MPITPNSPANFTPDMDTTSYSGYSGQGAFKFWCQKVLPLVYDDSLSYYETLCKVVAYLNNVISDISSLESNFQELDEVTKANVNKILEAYNQLQEYVNHYFDSLDVQTEINNKLDSMAEDGSLGELVKGYFKTTPVIVNDEGSMVDRSVLYILSTNGHYYQWDGEKFADTGLNANAGLNYITGNSSIITSTSGFSNAKDLPVNAFYAIGANYGKEIGLPINGYATLIKYSPLNSANMCVYLLKGYPPNSNIYVTITYADTEVTSDIWVEQINISDVDDFLQPDYNWLTETYCSENGIDNVNKLKHNRVYKVTGGFGKAIGLPENGYGSLLSYGAESDNNLTVYIYITYTQKASMYYCVVYRDTVITETSWAKSGPVDDFLQPDYNWLTETYCSENGIDNVNKLKHNRVYKVYGNFGESIGLPENGYGTILSYGAESDNNATVFLYTTYKNTATMYYTIVYRDTVVAKENWVKIFKTEDLPKSINANSTILSDSVMEEYGATNIAQLPSNVIYAVGGNWGASYGLPENGFGTLIKYSPLSQRNFTVMIYNTFPVNGNMYYCITYRDTDVEANNWSRVNKSVLPIIPDIGFSTNVVGFIGDSVVEGVGSSDWSLSGEAFTCAQGEYKANVGVDCWAGKLGKFLQDNYPNTTCYNHGVGGMEVYEVGESFDDDNYIKEGTKFVFIGCGLNTRALSMPQYNIDTGTKNVVNRLTAKGINFVFLTPNPVTSEPYKYKTGQIVQLMRQAFNKYQAPYIDIYGAFKRYVEEKGEELSTYLADGTHPNDKGYKLIYDIIMENMEF